MDAPSISDALAIAGVARVRALLIEAARAGEAVSYAQVLGRLGVRFTRPRMRALCRSLDRIDADGAAAGEPPLAVLVVRESDRLPGQGWWTARVAESGYAGAWTGPEAEREVRRLQHQAFAFWRNPPRARGLARSRGEVAMAEDHDQIAKEFAEVVNMTPSALDKWLKTDESKEVGTGVGHDEGERIVKIKAKKKADLTDDDYAHMNKVVGYVHRHLKQGGPKEDKENSPWRRSLMNWGHDPLK